MSYRQLDHWSRAHAIWPAVDAAGSGSRRGWTEADVERLRFINAGLSSLGDQVRCVAQVWRFLVENGSPDCWLLVGLDGGEWAVSVDFRGSMPDRNGLLIVGSPAKSVPDRVPRR